MCHFLVDKNKFLDVTPFTSPIGINDITLSLVYHFSNLVGNKNILEWMSFLVRKIELNCVI